MNTDIQDFCVSGQEFSALKDGTSHLFKAPLNEENLSYLPKAYEDASGTILIFPASECPKEVAFHTEDGDACRRGVINVMAYKMDDGSEILKYRLK